MQKHLNLLRIDASANTSASNSRKLGDILVQRIADRVGALSIKTRDLNQDLDFIDETWIGANFTPPGQRSEAQREALALSDRLIDELREADHIVLTTPMYNFGIPSTLKAWIDQVCRAGVTFQYGADGPVGLLRGKRADIIITTGGAPLQSPVDFVSPYLKQVFGFIGIDEVNIVGADQMNVDAEKSFDSALRQIELATAA